MATVTTSRPGLPLPILQGLLPLNRAQIPADLIAGLTLAALAIPEVMGYTKIAGTPVITGLYTLLIPMTLYALFGASRHLVVGADSATAAIIASSIAALAAPYSGEWLALAGLLALMSAVFMFLARVVRLGFLADFLSRTVLIGFLSGVGAQVALGEVSGMLGLPGGGHGTIEKLIAMARQIGQTNWVALGVAAAVIAIIVGSRMLSRRIPGALLAVICAIVVSWHFDLASYGIKVLGPVPSGLPSFGLPAGVWRWDLIQSLIPTAFALFVVILAQSAATSRAYAARYREPLDENVDLVGLGLANLGAGLTGTFVVNGSPTKSQMVASAGGHTQLAMLTTSAIVLLVLLFLTAPLAYMPGAVLSAVVFLIGLELIDVAGMKRVYAQRRREFWVALVTGATVVLVGVEESILLAIVLSLAVHTKHGYAPNNRLMAPNAAGGWRLHPVKTEIQAAPGLMIYRFMHDMYYANTHVFTEEVMTLVRSASSPLNWFCIDAAAVDDVDFTAAAALRDVHVSLADQGIRLVFSQLTDEVKAELDRSQLTGLVGADAFFPGLDAVLSAFEARPAGDGAPGA
ncbi:SulP family inorganic anion transporter [uncultured Thiodictyon sp.]|uniref:SulP family inorganic anion transporter n=1 Tax=uncultured Thiodictyon sp. TaxID=1846217 RepID=UPI0025F36379|nr:SulP family inorganic anion transporter [uncultured Thiodictyon sp.]